MSNRLARETSPYLLQHAHNPVEWYPWGEEALTRAREEDRPILLSIGYSACHWCHVMERESFEDPEVAKLMNERFVSVKVDREERPDLDAIYMRAVQAMTGHGGWPLTAFLTPEGVPYYGGTYFPPEPRQGMPSFRQVLRAVSDAWEQRREDVRTSAERIRELLARSVRPGGGTGDVDGAEPAPSLVSGAVRVLASHYDDTHGGFGGAPKFPQPVTLELLLRHHHRTGDRQARRMVVETLIAMARGGIRDHLGGGFHRYSVDARWLVPHFEKMLYDNALLAGLYARAWQVTGEVELREVAEDTVRWLLADLRAPEGGFYAARDADSEGEEGRFYVWTPEEVEAVLGADEARLFGRVYDVSPGGNFEGRSILHLPHPIGAVARSQEIDEDVLRKRLGEARQALLEARAEREPPLRDEKILVGWNGMAVRALAEAGAVLERDDWVEASRTAADFLLEGLRKEGRLLHVWTAGDARIPGFLEDHAALGNALLSLHESTLEARWLEEARWAAAQIVERFWDAGEGVFYDVASDGEPLVVRPRDVMDNATPSGTALAVELFLRLHRITGDGRLRERAVRALASEASAMERMPSAFGRLLSCLDLLHAPALEVAIFGAPADPATVALRRATLQPYRPERVVVGRDPASGEAPDLALLEGRGLVDGQPAAYVCRSFACRAPVTTPQGVAEALAEDAG